MVWGLNQAMFVTPPMDVRARRGYSIIYNLNKLDVPAIYSSMFTNSESPKEPSGLVPRFVAALAEAVHFLEMNPNRGKADLSKVLSINDQEVLQSAYDACAKSLVNRRIVVAVNAVSMAVETARADGMQIRKQPAEIIDNSFAEQLEKSGFRKELWAADYSGKKPRLNRAREQSRRHRAWKNKSHFNRTALN